MTWKLKLDENENPVFDDGKPVYIDPDGKELPLDPPSMYQKISVLGQENKTHRDKYQGLQDKYKPFEKIEDIEEWYKTAEKALETVENFNDKDWMKASKVEELKASIKSSFEEKLANKDTAISTLEKDHATELSAKDQKIRHLMVSSRFASSKYFTGDKSVTTLTPEIAEAYFGKHFKVEEENDKMVLRAYKSNGDVVLSKINPGDPAEFDEAMGIIIDTYDKKDSILRSGGPGSGGKGGGGGSDDDDDDLKSLQKQHQEALDKRDHKTAIALKNKIHAIQMKRRS